MQDELIIPSPLNLGFRVVVQDPHALVRECLAQVVRDLEGAEVVGQVGTIEELIGTCVNLQPDIAFLDLDDTAAALTAIRFMTRELPDTRIICLGTDPSHSDVEEAVKAGAVACALRTESLQQLRFVIEEAQMGRRTVAPRFVAPLLQSFVDVMNQKRLRDLAIIEALASAVDARDPNTGGHAHRVAALAAKLASHFSSDLGSKEGMRYGFLLHDIGKIGVPDAILHKAGSLTDSEWRLMRMHPLIGVQIVAPVGLGPDVDSIVRHHHERWDGHGYPGRLGSTEIPLGARLFALADTFDAMTSDRPYRTRSSTGSALREIASHRGTQFDPQIVDAFLDLVSATPALRDLDSNSLIDLQT